MAFPDPWIRQFSIKANDVPAIIAELAGLGLGANVVSRGEWARARRAWLPNESITLEGVGKTDADLRAAVSAARRGDPLRWIAVESPEEAEALATFAQGAHVTLDVLFRLNPDVAPETQAGLAVGSGASKFGMTETELTRTVQRLAGAAPGGLRPRGIHLHVGSQLGAIDAWRDGVRRAVAVLGLVRGSMPDFDTLDVGGGFPVAPFGWAPSVPAPGRFAREIPALLETVPADRRPLRLAVEPGRVLVARAGRERVHVVEGATRQRELGGEGRRALEAHLVPPDVWNAQAAGVQPRDLAPNQAKPGRATHLLRGVE